MSVDVADIFVAEGQTVPVGVGAGSLIFAVGPAGVEVIVDILALGKTEC